MPGRTGTTSVWVRIDIAPRMLGVVGQKGTLLGTVLEIYSTEPR